MDKVKRMNRVWRELTCTHLDCLTAGGETCLGAGWGRSSCLCGLQRANGANPRFLYPPLWTRSYSAVPPPDLVVSLHLGTPSNFLPLSTPGTFPSIAWTWSPLEEKNNSNNKNLLNVKGMEMRKTNKQKSIAKEAQITFLQSIFIYLHVYIIITIAKYLNYSIEAEELQ